MPTLKAALPEVNAVFILYFLHHVHTVGRKKGVVGAVQQVQFFVSQVFLVRRVVEVFWRKPCPEQ